MAPPLPQSKRAGGIGFCRTVPLRLLKHREKALGGPFACSREYKSGIPFTSFHWTIFMIIIYCNAVIIC